MENPGVLPDVSTTTTVSNDDARVIGLLERMKENIWSRRPILAEIMKKHGAEPLSEYAQDFLDVNHTPRLEDRRHELINLAQELIAGRLGPEVAAQVARQLTKLPLVSTADHHGPVTHPFFVNSNIISAIPYLSHADPDFKFLVSFSFASISVNNTSFPRGIVFHGKDNGAGTFIRLPILPDRLKMATVYGAPAFTLDDIAKAENQLTKKKSSGEVTAPRAEKISQLIKKFFASQDIIQSPDFASQITKINYKLWPAIFHADSGPESEPRDNTRIPDLIYLEIETLVTELLLRHHLNNQDSLLYKVFFDPEYQKRVAQFFNNLPGGFSLEEGWGTYIFWAMDEKLHRVRLVLKDGKLVSHEPEHSIDFTPEGIADALRRKQIFPSMLLSYLVVSLYYGMKCLGGFSQVNDLTMLKEAWGKFLESVGQHEEKAALVPIQTKELGGDGMVLSYMGNLKEGLAPATAIDMLIEHEEGRYVQYAELAKQITLAEAMSPLLPDIYNVLYSSPDRHPDFSELSSEKILQALGLDHKLTQD